MILTSKDINKLIEVFPTKDDVRTVVREEIADTKRSVQDLVTGIDKLVKAWEDLNREYAAMSEQLTRHDRWIKQLAERSGVSLTK